MGRQKRREPLSCFFFSSFPSPLARFLFSLSPASLRHKEASDRGKKDLLSMAVGLEGRGSHISLIISFYLHHEYRNCNTY